MVLTLVLAESSVELVPNEIATHPAVVRWARRKRKDPRWLILDQNYHHAAIMRLGRPGAKRGRPDIAHLTLLLALGSPLNMAGQLRCFVHTREDKIIRVDPRTRLPRNTERFVSLLEQLYQEKVVPPIGTPLLTLSNGTLQSLLLELNTDFTVALTTEGQMKPLGDVAAKLAQHKRPVVLIGGFSEGHFSKETLKLANESYRIHKRRLEAWTVAARAVYDYERALMKEQSEPSLM